MNWEIPESAQVALANMKANKMRSFFSMLGIVIGTMAVIVVTAIINGTREASLEELRAGREDMLFLMPTFNPANGRFGKLEAEDVERLKDLPFVKNVFPKIIHQEEVKGNLGKASVFIFAVDSDYTGIYHHQLTMGRFLNETDIKKRQRVCLISDVTAKKIFGFDYPVGQHVRLARGSLEVVGVFKSEDRLARMDQFAEVLVPLSTGFQLLNAPVISAIQILAETGQSDKAKKSLQQLMGEGGRLSTGVELSDSKDFLQASENWSRSWLIQMTLIASISLIVGGVGLMNVMLTTVAERTHEIGLRMALGADSRAILHQFMTESVVLSGLGGLLGILLGVLISNTLTIVSKGRILVSIVPLSLIVSFGFSLVIGLIFGLFPASKAAHLSPIEALRYE